MKIKSFSQVIKEAKEDDAKAIYLASEIDLIDKAEDNVKSDDPKKKTPEIEKKRKELASKYKEITGHEDIKKSIPESKIYEGVLDDLGISDIKDFGEKYAGQIKRLVGEIGGAYIGYFYDTPTKSIAIITDKGIGKYLFNPADDDFEEYQKMDFLK